MEPPRRRTRPPPRLRASPPPRPARRASKKTREICLKLPSDIVFEILIKLAVKSLLRFQSVCKSWCSTISNNSFAKIHLAHSQTHPIYFAGSFPTHLGNKLILSAIDKKNEDYNERPGSFIRDLCERHGSMRDVSEPLNGLICVVFDDNPSVKVCNPSTQEVIELPPIVDTPHPRSIHSLGYDPITDKYKILNISYTCYTQAMEHRVFTLGSESDMWRRIDGCADHIVFPSPIFQNSGRFCINGIIYFLGWDWGVKRNDDGTLIVAFHVGEEKFCVIPLPEGAPKFQYLLQYSGCLAVVDSHKKDLMDNTIKMWILQDYSNKLWMEHTIVLPPPLKNLLAEKFFLFSCIIHTGE
ncbi:hypothetical protein F0562_033516 [Nyssa sinensis]|uniref:F-box domain-containing protein n=1 Tax=Nyssa sinensis TaxID=561372 RepID=A0A5J5AGX3_9ASTE|nr:hypothetical protein F0562_033516 [Nyssa sinensis]